jgi:hypothetical protein
MRRALLVMTLAFAGCYTEADVGYGYGYAAPEPGLVAVSPGVMVVADYDYPVFYSEGFYWRSYGGAWYRSPYRDRGWVVGYNAPVGVRGIGRPEAYAHYHGNAGYGYGPGYRGNPGYSGGYRGGPAYNGPAHAAPVRSAPPVGGYRGSSAHAPAPHTRR